MKLFSRSRSIQSLPSSEQLSTNVSTRKGFQQQTSAGDPLVPTGDPLVPTAMDYESDDSDEEMEIVWSRSRYEIGKRDDLDIEEVNDDKYGSLSTPLAMLKSNSDEFLWRSLDEDVDGEDPFSYDRNESDWCGDEEEQNIMELRDDQEVKRLQASSPRKKNTTKSAKYKQMILSKRDAQTMKSLGDQSETDNENEEYEIVTCPTYKAFDKPIIGAIADTAAAVDSAGAVPTTTEDSKSIEENVTTLQTATVQTATVPSTTTTTKALLPTMKTNVRKEPAPGAKTTKVATSFRKRMFGSKKSSIKSTVTKSSPTVTATEAKVASTPPSALVKPEPPKTTVTSKQEPSPSTTMAKSESSLATPKKSNVAAPKTDTNPGWFGTKATIATNKTTTNTSTYATKTLKKSTGIPKETTFQQSSTPTEKTTTIPNGAATHGAAVTAIGTKASRRPSLKERLSGAMTRRNPSIRNAPTPTVTVTADSAVASTSTSSTIPSEVVTTMTSTTSAPPAMSSFDELLNSTDDYLDPTADTTSKPRGESAVDDFLTSIFHPVDTTPVAVAESVNTRAADNVSETSAFVNCLRATVVCAPVADCLTTYYGHSVPQTKIDTTSDHQNKSISDYFGCREEVRFLQELFQEEPRGDDTPTRSLAFDGMEKVTPSRSSRDSIPIQSIEFLTPPESDGDAQETRRRSKKELAVDTTLNSEEPKSPSWLKNPPPKTFGRFLRRASNGEKG